MNSPFYADFNQMIKRPLRTMKALFIMYLILSSVASLLGLFSIVSGELNYPLAVAAILLSGITWVIRYGFNELAKCTKRGWIITMVFSAHLIPSLLLPLGIYSLTGLLDKSVRARCLDGAGEETPLSTSLSAT